MFPFPVGRLNPVWCLVLTAAVLHGRAQVSPVFPQLRETATDLLLSLQQLVLFRLEPLGVRFHSVLPVFVLIHACGGGGGGGGPEFVWESVLFHFLRKRMKNINTMTKYLYFYISM